MKEKEVYLVGLDLHSTNDWVLRYFFYHENKNRRKKSTYTRHSFEPKAILQLCCDKKKVLQIAHVIINTSIHLLSLAAHPAWCCCVCMHYCLEWRLAELAHLIPVLKQFRAAEEAEHLTEMLLVVCTSCVQVANSKRVKHTIHSLHARIVDFKNWFYIWLSFAQEK